MKQNNFLDLEQITDYILGNLTAAEKVAFELELQRNKALQEEVALMRDVLKGIEAKGDSDFRQNLILIEKGLQKESFFTSQNTDNQANAKKKSNIFQLPMFRYAIAAALLGFGLIFWFSIQQNNSPNNIAKNNQTENNTVQTQPQIPIIPIEKNTRTPSETPLISKSKTSTAPHNIGVLKQENANAGAAESNYIALAESAYNMPAFATGRGEKELAEQLLDSAATHLRKRAFSKALEVLNSPIFNENDVTKSKVMRAHAFFGLKEYKTSLSLFQAVCDSKIMPYSEESEYYLLLCYLTQYSSEKGKYEALKQKILLDREHPAYEKVTKMSY
jgi:hypothetical protein